MSFTCKKFYKISHNFHIKLLTPQADLDHSITWFYYMEDPSYINWLKGGELVLTTGSMLGDSAENYIKFIDQIIEKDAAALIINLSPYISKISPKIIEHADFLGFPIFEMPAEIAILNVSETVCRALIEATDISNKCSQFLSNLIYEDEKISTSLLKRAISYGFLPESDYRCVLFNITSYPITSISDKIYDENIDMDTVSQFENYTLHHMKNADNINMILPMKNQLLFLYPCDNIPFLETQEALEYIIRRYMEYSSLYVFAGISPVWKGLANFHSNYKKASDTIKLIPHQHLNGYTHTLCYEELDTLFLLLSKKDISDLKEIYSHALDPLITFDEINHADLLHTLNAYIENNAILTNTADALFIHINTLRYRLKKIEQLLNCDLKNINVLFQLNLNLKIQTYCNILASK